MAITIAQAIATAATGGTRAATLTATLVGVPTNGNTLAFGVAWDANPSGGGSGITVSSISGSLALQSQVSLGSINLAVYRLTGTINADQSVTVNFSGGTYASCGLIETSTPASVKCTTATFGAFGTNQVIGNLPTTDAPLAGDLPIAFFAARDAATVVAQGGWTELANLNNTGGQFAQLEIQQGPVTVSSPQNVTGQATWSGTPGDTNNVALLAIFSSSPPYALDSQAVIETLDQNPLNARLSQEVLESLDQNPLNARVSQEVLETLCQDTTLARLSQVVVEVICPISIHVSQEVLESLDQNPLNVRLSQVCAEVLWSSQGQRRRVVDDEFTR